MSVAGRTLVYPLFLGILFGVVPVSAAPSQPLQQAMSVDEFTRAGLGRLTREELEFLNLWLGRSATGAQPTFGAEQLPAEPPSLQDEQELLTTVRGEFEGWSGRTVFTLANGQVWQQRLPGKYAYRATDPEVRLKRGRFGYYLELRASGRQVAVKRLR